MQLIILIMTKSTKIILALVGVSILILIKQVVFHSTSSSDGTLESSSQDTAPIILSGVESRFGFQANIAAPGGGSYQTTLITYNWVLFQNGKMIKKLPETASLIEYCTNPEPSNPCLDYQIDSDGLKITENGEIKTYGYDSGTGQVTIKPKVILSKVEPLTNSAISGKWHRSNFSQSIGYGGNVSSASEQQIYFEDNGYFANHKFSGFIGSGSLSTGYQNRSENNQGSYELDGYFLNLKYEDGFTANHVAFKYPNEDLISIDGKNFIK